MADVERVPDPDDPLTDPADPTPSHEGAGGGRPTAARAVVIGAAVVAVLLLGAAIGLLVKVPGADTGTTPGRDSVDVGFSQDMAVHHVQAVTMSNIALDRTGDDAVRQLAFDIGSTQLEQVGRMKGWLTLWRMPEQPAGGTHMAWMSEPGATGHHDGTVATDGASAGRSGLMPGMATSEELAKLRSLGGTEFDVYFLQLMLRHHQGGAPMAAYGAEHAEQDAVRTLADNMLRSQTGESEYMEHLLADRGAAPLQ
ncbi:DUF305 domain-containing protein [Actinosynnema mirum]|uniref:DUF305 domain-containing protein n=1 Tax=Actinosynnema mirum (strain ATCC 29888 / DSM 43827 / JCM 3225 / NBRC 14064 / NCIMB 13271 / NRRL B-12336 / IMRU 3971 / 101) TaxID=446462 RepID=C6WHL8_ACTMD|nr:DUF305 domain-containing protein [Actinosynnema mirum]ACU39967.1 protein of unknown function DUF305 [Actinosynnema mirum DSM 43827]